MRRGLELGVRNYFRPLEQSPTAHGETVIAKLGPCFFRQNGVFSPFFETHQLRFRRACLQPLFGVLPFSRNKGLQLRLRKLQNPFHQVSP